MDYTNRRSVYTTPKKTEYFINIIFNKKIIRVVSHKDLNRKFYYDSVKDFGYIYKL